MLFKVMKIYFKMKKKLNLGSGEDYKEGYVNLDNRGNVKKDVNWDLNNFPYPFDDNNFDEIYAKHILTCLEYPIKTLHELARITRTTGQVILITHHAISYSNMSGFVHNCSITENSFRDNAMREYQLDNKLKLISYEFIFIHNWKKYIPFKKYFKIFLRGLYDDIKFEFEVK